VELAREEAFPWCLAVRAEHVMFLARIDRKTFFDRVRDLENLVLVRPARRIRLLSEPADGSPPRTTRSDMLPRWPSAANHWRVDQGQPLADMAQWVIRYRRGTPWHPGRAAWWINYDLLCGTQRVLPCFEVGLATLAPDYKSRRRPFGPGTAFDSEDEFREIERSIARSGPMPPLGMRSALWEGAEFC
jgi:hypothetical protein